MILYIYFIADLIIRVISQQKTINKHRKGGRDRRMTMMMILVAALVLTFIICWLPHHVINIMILYTDFQWTKSTFCLKIASHCLSFCHGKSLFNLFIRSNLVLGMLNPLLYSFASEWMRVHLSQIIDQYTCLRCICNCIKSNPNYSSAPESVYDYKKPKLNIHPSKLAANPSHTSVGNKFFLVVGFNQNLNSINIGLDVFFMASENRCTSNFFHFYFVFLISSSFPSCF